MRVMCYVNDRVEDVFVSTDQLPELRDWARRAFTERMFAMRDAFPTHPYRVVETVRGIGLECTYDANDDVHDDESWYELAGLWVTDGDALGGDVDRWRAQVEALMVVNTTYTLDQWAAVRT